MNTKRRTNGLVHTQELSHTRRFKYTFQGKCYFITLPKIENPDLEKQVAKMIELDMSRQNLDISQHSYKEMLVLGRIPEVVAPLSPARATSFILHQELLKYYTAQGRDVKKDFYNAAWVMLKNWGDQVTVVELPQRLMNMRYASKTFNNRKGILTGFCNWLLRNKRIEYNVMLDVPSKKKAPSKQKIKLAMTNEEIKKILEGIKSDKYVDPLSRRYNHSHYHPFMTFMAVTGCRPAEAIGLQVKKINFETKMITIDDSLARSRFGTCSKHRTRKGTKMNDSRVLSYQGNEVLESILVKQCENKKPNDLIFPSPTGVSIDDKAINNHVLKPVMEGLGIERRSLYAFRHSFATRCFENGMGIKEVQSQTGHRDVSVLVNTYAEVSRMKVHLPVF